MGQWLNENLHYLQTTTVMIIVLAISGMWLVGHCLMWLVHNRQMVSQTAVRIIGSIATLFGIVTGSMAIMVILMILWPDASNWVVNTYLPKTLIWQTEFQQWLAEKVSDRRMATTMGLVMKSYQFGSMLLGAVLSHVARAIFSILMKKSYHEEICMVEKLARLRPRLASDLRAALGHEH
jgi:hypothetical protein